jgi:hypothetical protein
MAIQNINYREILGQNFARQQLADRLAADDANREAMASLNRDIRARLAEQRREEADRAEAMVRSRGAVELGAAVGGGLGEIGGELANIFADEKKRKDEGDDRPFGDYLKDEFNAATDNPFMAFLRALGG